jgi:hypothetical protein
LKESTLHYWRQKEKGSFIGCNKKSRRDIDGAMKMQCVVGSGKENLLHYRQRFLRLPLPR